MGMTEAEAVLSERRREAIISAAAGEGLLGGERAALGARTPRALVARAKARSGIQSTSALVEYALARVALEDDFAERLVARRGSLPTDFDLGL